MVTHALQQVAHQFRVEERHGQLQQFDEEVAHQRDVDAHGDMQQQPAPDEVGRGAPDDNHQFA